MSILHDIATVVPDHFYTQTYALEFLSDFQGDTASKRHFLRRVYEGSGIEKRHSVVADYHRKPEEHKFYPPTKTLMPEPSTGVRNKYFIEHAIPLACAAVTKLFAQVPRLKAADITHIITVSCTGFMAPGLDFHLRQAFEMSENIDCYNLGFMGCYAAIPALKLAHTICEANPKSKVLLLNVELCSIHFKHDFDPEVVVANAIFADGVSAAFVSGDISDSDGPHFKLQAFLSKLLPESAKDMAWEIGDRGFDMRLSTYVPAVVSQNLDPVLGEILGTEKLTVADVELWAVHPGGRAILDQCAASLSFEKTQFWASYEILKNYGNMSSASVMFVLKRLLDSEEMGKTFAVAFGPGLMVESALLEKI